MGDYTIKEIKSIKICDIYGNVVEMNLSEFTSLLTIEEEKKEEELCILFPICNCKTAICRVELPDESCYYYRYFKKLIEEKNLKKF